MTEEKDTRTPEEAREPAESNAEASPGANAEGNAPEMPAPEEETPETLADTEEVAESEVAEDLGTSAAKGPALDQDEGQIQTDTERNRRKERIGLVVSDKADKTVTVAVETLVRHKRYKKRVRSTKKFMAHDEANEARMGDTVRIVETRPLSARKRWRLGSVISRVE